MKRTLFLLVMFSVCTSFAQRRGRGEASTTYQRSTRQGWPGENNGQAAIGAAPVSAVFSNTQGDWLLTVYAHGQSCVIDHFWWTSLETYQGSCDVTDGTIESVIRHTQHSNAYIIWVGYTPDDQPRVEFWKKIVL